MSDQRKIDTVLLTHHHFDHTRDLVTLAANAGYLCPRLLREELIQFRRLKGRLPRVVVVRIGNPYEQEIGEEVAQVAQELEADISLGL